MSQCCAGDTNDYGGVPFLQTLLAGNREQLKILTHLVGRRAVGSLPSYPLDFPMALGFCHRSPSFVRSGTKILTS